MAVACVAAGETDLAALTRKPSPLPDKRLTIEIDGKPAPPGEEGELVVYSQYLADGYWRRPQTADSPFQPAPPGSLERSFRTGDMGRLLEDGSFEFLGRRDNQVKIRGYRVELREVEQAILDDPTVGEAAGRRRHARRQEHPRRLCRVPAPGAAYDEKGVAHGVAGASLAVEDSVADPCRRGPAADGDRQDRQAEPQAHACRGGSRARDGGMNLPGKPGGSASATPKPPRDFARDDVFDFENLVQHTIETFDRLTGLARKEPMDPRMAVFLAEELLSHGHPDTLRLTALLKQHPHRDAVAFAHRIERCFGHLRAQLRIEDVSRNQIVRAYRKDGYLLYESAVKSRKLLVVFTTIYNNFFISHLNLHAMLKDIGCHLLLLKETTLAQYQRGVVSFAKDLPDIADQIRATARKLGADEILLQRFFRRRLSPRC